MLNIDKCTYVGANSHVVSPHINDIFDTNYTTSHLDNWKPYVKLQNLIMNCSDPPGLSLVFP